MNHRTQILPGVYLTAVQSDKFKTGCFSLNLLRPMKKEEAAANALIPSVLLRGSVLHPDIASISAKLDELYGASIGTLIRKKGEVQLVGFYCDYVQDEYVQEPVFAPLMEFLSELLFSPRLENGAFPAGVVESEKQNLLNAILSTGTGLDADNAWYVVYPMHEYDLLQLLGYEPIEAEYPADGMDRLKVKPLKDARRFNGEIPGAFYFNVKIPQEEYIRKHPGEE